MTNKYLFVIKSVYIVLYESFKYLFKKDKVKYLDNITKKLSRLDIIYVKIFQSLATNDNIFNEEQLNKLILYTDQVPYSLNEYESNFYELNEKINKVNNININNDNNDENKYCDTNILITSYNSENDNDNDTNILIDTIEYINSGMISLVYKAKMVNGKNVIIKVKKKIF